MRRLDELSEQEISRYLRPPTPWFSIIGPILAIASVIGGGIWWAARSPDPAEFKKAQSDIVEIRIGQSLTQENVKGLRDDVGSIKTDLKQLLMQRRK
jgi:hypothetical protein